MRIVFKYFLVDIIAESQPRIIENNTINILSSHERPLIVNFVPK